MQNMAAGEISATSTDAINGSQLYATNKAIEAISATTGAGWVITTRQTGSGVATGSAPTVVASGSTATFTAGDNIAITQVGTEVQIATKPDLVLNSVTTGHTVMNNNGITITGGPNNTVSLTNTGLNNGGNVITNVAPGVAPTDAVNVSQLNATNQYIDQVDNRVTQVDNRVTQVAEIANCGWDLSTNGGPATNIKPGGLVNIDQGSNVVVTQSGGNITVGVVNNPTFSGPVITNGGLNVAKYLTVQPGTIVNFSGNVIQNIGAGVNPGDAVNVQQLQDAENRSVQYARNPDGSVDYNSVPLRGDQYDPNTGQGGTTISNVAQGRNPSDAVNVQQLGNVAGELRGRIDQVDRKASAGTASAMAMTGIPQAYLPGKSLFGAGISSYRGQAAIALGLSAISDNGKWIVKGSLSRNSQGHTGVAVGAGFQW
ncbi:MAG: YadA-like family protein [Burkholderiales bacterium]|nr:YadA-like family protein [Burkholderiales bacterium]MBK8664625.1 YadA-like family protein [Burkholderiales bacterium]